MAKKIKHIIFLCKPVLKLFLLILVILFVTKVGLLAKQNKKISVAVVVFKENNCPKSIAQAATDMFEGNLYKAKMFTLLDRSQMDRIARLHGFAEYDTANQTQMAKLGSLLKVDKIIVGTVTKLDSYKINVKAMQATTGVIDYSAEVSVETIAGFDTAISKISIQVERYYLGYYNLSGLYDLSVNFTAIYPTGVMLRGTKSGVGLNAVCSFNKLLYQFDLITAAGLYSMFPDKNFIKTWYMLPIQVYLGYTFLIAKNLRVQPSIGAGYLFSRIEFDTYEHRLSGDYNYTMNYYYNPLVACRGELSVLLYDRWYLTVVPGFILFFEREKTGGMVTLDLGIKMLF